MWSIVAVFHVVISILLFLQFKTEAKTYYFNLNRTSNEYMIRTRVNQDNSDPNYATGNSGVYLSELRNNITRAKDKVVEVRTHPLLDPEWEYNWKNITRRKLPTYIYKFYETFSKDMTGPIRILFNAMPQNSTIIRFNLSSIDTMENISDVELHFYHTVNTSLLQKPIILRLYQMEKTYFNESSLINPDAHKLLNVIYIYQAESGWQVFRLTNVLYNWLKERADLLLFITISKPNEEQFSLFKDKNLDVFRTFIILKSESQAIDFSPINKAPVHGNLCQKRELHIDFKKLNWMQFIVSPSGYHAFSCVGMCYRNGNLSNHMKVATFVPELARKPLCCTPTKYSPLSIMFYDKNGNIVIKVYEEMIISACGCR